MRWSSVFCALLLACGADPEGENPEGENPEGGTKGGCPDSIPSLADCTSESDVRSSGSPDWAADHVMVFDACGYPTESMQYSLNGDATLSTLVYDDDHRLVEHHMDMAPADGATDYLMTFTYDGQGRLVGMLQEWLTLDFDTCVWTYVYNDGDALFDETHIDCGATKTTQYYAYDTENELILTLETDYGDDGVMDVIRSYSYDDAGREVSTVLEVYADDLTGEKTYTTWDGDDRIVHEVDEGGEGVIDTRTTYSYDADGRQLTSRQDDLATGDWIETETAWTCQ